MIIYVITCAGIETLDRFREASLVRRLMRIMKSLNAYRDAHETYPKQNLVTLGLSDYSLRDPFTDELFLYHPDTLDLNKPIVEQASEYRIGLWPFMEKRRYGLYRDGQARDILHFAPHPMNTDTK